MAATPPVPSPSSLESAPGSISVSAPPTVAPTTSPAAPPSGFGLQAATRLQAALDEWVDRGLAPSLSAAVVVDGGGKWAGAAGLADTAAAVAAEPATSYAVGSVTKVYTASVVLDLAERGLLDLDDDAAEWLDEPAKANGATIRQLLTMRSGIHDPVNHSPQLGLALTDDPGRVWTPQDFLELVGAPNARAGTFYEYSNTNYILLGLVAERAAGRTMADLVNDLVQPLGLRRTALAPEAPAADPYAHGYMTLARELRDVSDGGPLLPTRSFASVAWAAGGISAPAMEVATFADALYGGRVLSPASLDQMLDFGPAFDYGMGAAPLVLAPGLTGWGHDGGTAGFSSLLVHLAERRMTIVILSNKFPFDLRALARQLAEAVN